MKAHIFLSSPGLEGLLTPIPTPTSRCTVAQSLLREEWVVGRLSRRGAGVAEVDTPPPPHTHTHKKWGGEGSQGLPVIAPPRPWPEGKLGRRDRRMLLASPDLLTVHHYQRPRLMLSRPFLVMQVSHLFLKLIAIYTWS